MKTTGWIESRHNPDAWTPGSQYGGMMQLGNNEGRGINRRDPIASIDRAGQLAASNRYHFIQVMGREPTASEIYLMHQQGAGGIGELPQPHARNRHIRHQDGDHQRAKGQPRGKTLKRHGRNPQIEAVEYAPS